MFPAQNTVFKVSIIGGGLSGLATAYYLLQKDQHDITIYEKNKRYGGRCSTTLIDDIPIEHAGEFIDQEHTFILHLVKDLGLELEEVDDFKPLCLNSDFEPLSLPEINTSFCSFFEKLLNTERDKMSLEDALGLAEDKNMLSLVRNMSESVFGGSSKEQSVDNMFSMVKKSYPNINIFNIYGTDKPKYRIKGGNQNLVRALLTAIGPKVTFCHSKIDDPSTLPGKVISSIDFTPNKTYGVGKVYKVSAILPQGNYGYTDIITTDPVLQSLWFHKHSLVTLTTWKNIKDIEDRLTLLVSKVFNGIKILTFCVDEHEYAYPFKTVGGAMVSFDKLNSSEDRYFIGDWTSEKYQGYMNGAVESAYRLSAERF